MEEEEQETTMKDLLEEIALEEEIYGDLHVFPMRPKR